MNALKAFLLTVTTGLAAFLMVVIWTAHPVTYANRVWFTVILTVFWAAAVIVIGVGVEVDP